MFLTTVVLLILAFVYTSIWQWQGIPGLVVFPFRLFLPIAVLGYFASGVRSPLGQRPAIIRYFYAFLAFLGFYLGCLVIPALDVSTAFTNWVNIMAGLLVAFLFCETAYSDRRLNQLTLLLVLVLVGLLLVSTWEINTGQHLISSALHPLAGNVNTIRMVYFSEDEANIAMRFMPTGTSWNMNDHAYRLFILMAITMSLFIVARSMIAKAAIVAIQLWAFYVVAKTGSRACLLATVIGAGVFLFTALRAGVRGRTIAVLVILAAIGVGGAMVVSSGESTLVVSKSGESRVASGLIGQIEAKWADMTDLFTTGEWMQNTRINLTINSLSYCVQSLGLGIGPGQVDVWNERRADLPTGKITSPHNMWAEFIAEGGVPMCLPLFIFMGVFMRRCFRGARGIGNPALAGHAAAVFALLIGVIPAAISPSGGITDITTWLVFGYAAAVIRRLAEAERAQIEDWQAYEYARQNDSQAESAPGY